MNKQKLIVILGPTATGKSDLAVNIALKHDGEVVSADSRQVYKGLNLGTGKITKKEMRGVSHHVLDVVEPTEDFSVAQYKELANKAIKDIISRSKLPILAGGTGMYIDSVVYDIVYPEVPPNEALREKLESKTLEELQTALRDSDKERFESIEKENPRRLIRAIEIATELGKVPKLSKKESRFDVLKIGLTVPPEELKVRITDRIIKRIDAGMIKEIEDLHAQGLPWERMHSFGLEYRYISQYINGDFGDPELDTSLEKMIEKLSQKTWQFAKRQMTWLKKDKEIKWVSPRDMENIEKEVVNFLN